MNSGQLLKDILKQHGFSCKGTLCKRVKGDVVQLVLVSKSRFERLFDIEVGVLHPHLKCSDEKAPPSWHIFTPYAQKLFRLSGLAPDQHFLHEAMDDASNLSAEERSSRLSRLIDFVEETFFDQFSSVSAIEEYARECSIPQILCTSTLRKLVAEKAGRAI